MITERSTNTKLTDRGARSDAWPPTRGVELPQLWVLPADRHPMDAIKDDGAAAVCGDCPIKTACYVGKQVVSQVWKHSRSNPVTPLHELWRDGTEAWLLRLGAWGDPAAIPFSLVEDLSIHAKESGIRRRTGYTHQWRTADERFRALVMASVEGTAMSPQAWDLGYRTFAAVPDTGEVDTDGHFECPATSMRANRLTCERCGLCNGTESGAKSVWIRLHNNPGRMRLARENLAQAMARGPVVRTEDALVGEGDPMVVLEVGP